MKEQSARVEPSKSAIDSLLAAFAETCEPVSQAGDLRGRASRLANELKEFTGASSVSIFLSDRERPELHLFASSDENILRSEITIPASREPVSSVRKAKRSTHLNSKSKHFSEFRDSIFSGAVVDSINLYPLKTGTDFFGLIVAAFWEADGAGAGIVTSDHALQAAARQLSIAIHSLDNEARHAALKDKYNAALSQLTSVVFILKLPTGKLSEANDAFFRSFGYDKSDLSHLTLFDIASDSKENVEEHLRRAMEADTIHLPSKLYKHRNGSVMEMEVRGTTISYGGSKYAIITAVDLAEKRKAELEAELQRVRYESFIRNSAEGIWRIEFPDPIDINQERSVIAKEITERGVIAEGNRAFARMYGFDDPAQLIGKRALEFVADGDVYAASKLKFTEQDFSITNIETVEKDRYGNVLRFENSYIGETRDGKLLRMWGIQRDITEKLKLQDQLRASENRYRNLVEQANDMVLLFNDQGEFVFANKRFFEQTGYKADEIWGRPLSAIVHPADSDQIMEKIAEQFRSTRKHIRYTLRFITKFNEEKIVELGMTTLQSSERTTGLLAIGRDVTVEQSVKTALHESEEKYRSLVEHSLLGVLVIQDDNIVYANPTSSKLFETEVQSLSGVPLSAFIHPNDYVQVFEKFEQAALAPNKDVQFSVRAITATGKIRSIEGWAAGITYLGKPAIQVAMVDVTDTIKLREQLIQSQKMESIGQLASGVAHDFNNLLGSIYGAISILRKKYSSTDANLAKYVDILDASAKRAAELTSQLLTFSRQRESNIRPVRLNDTVNDAMKIIIRSIGKNIKVEYSLDPMLHNIEADPSQIEGIIINLSINSRDAMPTGGVLRIETSNVELDGSAIKQIPDARPGRYACLAVTDNGVGMDESTRRKIFEPFFTTKPIGKGTGLGLSIVYGIVKNHKGFINVYSEPKHGTTFKVYLPATEKAPVDGAAGKPKEILHGEETILLIDDELTLLDLTREILEGLGYKVITAEGALEGIRVYRERYSEVDLVILDMLMPEMTGDEVFPVLKNINSEVSVLLATGLSVGEKVDEMISLGVNDVVAKPYSVSDLATHIRKVIDSEK